MATYAIGDIHGNLRALEGVLAQVEPKLTSDDVVVFLGDYVDGGSESRGCLERILRLRREAPCPIRALLGNHEEWLLRTLHDGTRHSWLVGMQGLTTVASYSEVAARELRKELAERGADLVRERVRLPYDLFFNEVPPEHLAFLEGLEVFVRTPDVVCVHGGALSGVPIEDQAAHDLVWGPVEFPESYLGPEVLVYGHRGDGEVEKGRGQPRVNRAQSAYGIDTIGKGVLTCLRFPDLKVFSAPA